MKKPTKRPRAIDPDSKRAQRIPQTPEEWRPFIGRGAQEWNEWRSATGYSPLNLENLFLADMTSLAGIDFSGCNLAYTDLRWNNLRGANFRNCGLNSTDLTDTQLGGSDFSGARFASTILGATDLSQVNGLSNVTHTGPSVIGIQTLLLSGKEVPESFYLGAGVPQVVIDYIPSLVGALSPIQFQSCFISYSSSDEEFAKRLHQRLRSEGLRVWFAPEDMQGGKRIFDQLEDAIHIHDRLLLVLSDASMSSGWVATEVRNARNTELRETRKKLFPLRVVPYERVQTWRLQDSDRGVNLAAEVREYFIPDFSNWKDHDAFEAAFAKLLRDLRSDA